MFTRLDKGKQEFPKRTDKFLYPCSEILCKEKEQSHSRKKKQQTNNDDKPCRRMMIRHIFVASSTIRSDKQQREANKQIMMTNHVDA